MTLDQAIAELRDRNEPVPKPMRLPRPAKSPTPRLAWESRFILTFANISSRPAMSSSARWNR